MKPHPFRLNHIATLFALGTAGMAAAADAPLPDVVVISGSRVEHGSFDLPAAIDVLDTARIRDGQLRVNASESLSAVPGLVAQNRQNYAQDLQISSRGFGARSAFGVRGVRLIADGIPATMPDGQGQAATFNLDMAERIEVLRGPFSAIYGNHSGGTVQLFTRDGQGRPSIEGSVIGGSNGTRKVDVNAQGAANGIDYVIDTSRFDTDGYRAHSAATRDQSFAKLTFAPTSTSKLTLTASALNQDDTQDPLGVTWATYQRDPRAGETDATDTQTPKRTIADRYNTRKSIDHKQIGAAFEQRLGDDKVRAMVYGGNRQIIQYQAFSKFVQTPASQSGGVVDFDRDFYGADINWLMVRSMAGGKLSTTIGIDVGRSTDERQGYENFIGNQFGLQGKLRRDESNTVSSVDPYAQAEWQGGDWVLTAGLRHSRVKVSVDDRFLTNGNDSGEVSYRHTTPVLGALYKITPTLNVYASTARGFETPTLNELFYSGAGAGFNFALKPATSTHVEAGVKAYLGSNTRINAALFHVKTSDELVVDISGGGRTSYRNASETLRKGAEVSLDSNLGAGFSGRLAMTALNATYEQGFGNVATGSRLPGVPKANLFGELAWKSSDDGFGAALETIASGKVYADDANLDIAAPGYAILNARFQAKQSLGGWRLKQFVRLNNLGDRRYVGSVIVGDANKRFYEAAPQRNWLAGVSAQYVF
ncbi:TonB-dependent receptor family protein [Massilia antarctica]|uniref:TonB-dependent receptor family protein n=1 Tax=Massilia antarctica TaxID=2765360 RepID=UPI0006BB9002|nr:TonB-dependent receptor [Massilia sp. H27-R4]MCY0916420.1 TonB-dependent receptor [Massilia sp. H27-R4]CUI07234.1 Probable tonB-dependent receptor yncD precursor [Janthinobacterium sp. CG23_2]CUU31020.1 Probable tonB-dependent receptor yncD precursor [Janthinobacterium sp. CG23_2]